MFFLSFGGCVNVGGVGVGVGVGRSFFLRWGGMMGWDRMGWDRISD